VDACGLYSCPALFLRSMQRPVQGGYVRSTSLFIQEVGATLASCHVLSWEQGKQGPPHSSPALGPACRSVHSCHPQE